MDIRVILRRIRPVVHDQIDPVLLPIGQAAGVPDIRVCAGTHVRERGDRRSVEVLVIGVVEQLHGERRVVGVLDVPRDCELIV